MYQIGILDIIQVFFILRSREPKVAHTVHDEAHSAKFSPHEDPSPSAQTFNFPTDDDVIKVESELNEPKRVVATGLDIPHRLINLGIDFYRDGVSVLCAVLCSSACLLQWLPFSSRFFRS
ncbi:hypothetical protein NC652_028005 [Populus alba x Populus x berolinensis]|nr:hypothetical protein NC652_028005 [Populus alba x Populus x berolinensis]